jgi:outer membrane lipoprotein carrier protein
LLQRTQTAYQALAGFQGEFQQEDREPSGRVLTAKGKIAYRKPGQMRWEYAAPNEQLLVTDGTTVWLFDPLLENVTVQPLEGLT